jgi:D-inositol-3-phosphate glycosyltransferase
MVHTSPLDQAGTGDAGGMNIYVVETAKKMADSGVKVDIFTRASKSGMPASVEIADGVTVKHLEVGPHEGLSKEELPGQISALTSEFMKLQKQLPKDYYDVIHSHYWISGQLGWMISEQTGIPLIQTMHTMAKVKNLNLAVGEKPEPKIRALGEMQVVKAATGLIANTDAEAASLVSYYDACPDNVFVVAPGVDLQTFHPGAGKSVARAKLNIAPDALVLTFVGRIQPHKGPEILIRAIAEMIGHSPALRKDLTVLIVGGTSGSGSAEVERMRELVGWLGIQDVVRFEPPVTREHLPNYYRAADLVAVPSYSESFGLVALEAQACGTPVIASAVGGLRTAVADGISGVLVDGHDPRAWSSVIARLLQEPHRRILLSMGALEHASHFGWNATARGTLGIYDRVLDAEAARKKSVG